MAEMSEGIAIENDSHYPQWHSSLSFPTIRSRYALARRIFWYNTDVHGDTQHDTSERSERVIHRLWKSLRICARVTEC